MLDGFWGLLTRQGYERDRKKTKIRIKKKGIFGDCDEEWIMFGVGCENQEILE